jgi:hypothetical protein
METLFLILDRPVRPSALGSSKKQGFPDALSKMLAT